MSMFTDCPSHDETRWPELQPSNDSNASSRQQRFVDSGVPWYYAYTVEFVLPATLPLGVVANVLSLLVLPRRSVRSLT